MKLTVDIFKGEKYFVARVPELGVTTQGETIEEAKENLKEAVQLHLQSVVEYMLKNEGTMFENNKIIRLEK